MSLIELRTKQAAKAFIDRYEDKQEDYWRIPLKELVKRLHAENISEKQAKEISKLFLEISLEIGDALYKKDEQAVYAYKHIPEKLLKSIHHYNMDCYKSVDDYVVSLQQQKKLKKLKKTPEKVKKIIAKLNYLKEWDKFKSVDPSKLIFGVKSLWTFEPKYDIVTYYKGNLVLKGQKIEGVDFSKSKRISNASFGPVKEMLSLIIQGTNAVNVFNFLNVKELEAKNKITKGTLILRID